MCRLCWGGRIDVFVLTGFDGVDDGFVLPIGNCIILLYKIKNPPQSKRSSKEF